MQDTTQTRTLAWKLSLAGFLPFAILSLVLFATGGGNTLFPPLFDIFKIWSAIILSFLGGIRWGLAIAYAPGEPRNLVLSVIPPILAWIAVLLPDAYTVLVLMVLFCAQGAWDNFYAGSGHVQPWYGSLRMVLTLLVVAAHVLVLFSISGTPDIGQLGELVRQVL
jgi:hypothetical protein